MEQDNTLIQLTDKLQNLLHGLIESVANGDLLTPKYKVLFPTFYKHSRVRVKDELKELYRLLRKINVVIHGPKFCEKALDKLKVTIRGKKVKMDEFLVIISGAYRIFSELVSMLNTEGCKSRRARIKAGQALAPYNISALPGEHELPVCNELQKYVNEKMAKYLVSFFIQGSVSTLDFTDFSDLDTVLILKEETVYDPQKLKKFIFHSIISLCYTYQFQHLHHHGHTIITEQDMSYYNQVILPCEIFKYSTPLCGSKELTFYTKDSRRGHLRVLQRLLRSFKHYLSEESRYQMNPWHFRYFIGTILLLPTLYLETLGIYVYKKFSFEKAKKYLSTNWEVVNTAEEIRKRWAYFPSRLEKFLAYFFLEVKKNPMVFEYLMARISRGVMDQVHQIIDRCFWEKCVSFSVELTRKTQQSKTGIYG